MSFTIFEQVHILLYSALFGCIAGVIAELYNKFYHATHSAVCRFVGDIIVSIIFTTSYFIFIITFCKGRVSIFQSVFFAVGVLLTYEITDYVSFNWNKLKKILKK